MVARVRKALKTRAVGHTGTLDPFATGLLVVLVGRATRLARFVEQQAKTYLATARLGVVTATDDATGEVLATMDPELSAPADAEIGAVMARFLGRQRQRPPAYSAKHVDGERSYRKARRGETVTLPEVEITVSALSVVRYQWPELEFRATVSPGAYVRALARDVGERLETGAHLTALRREAIGGLRVEQAVPLAELGPETTVLPPLAVLGHLAQQAVSEEEARAVGYGQGIAGRGPEGGVPVALVHEGRLVAIAEHRDGRLAPTVVLEPAS